MDLCNLGDTMIDKMENEQSVTCPVCGGLLREHLPCMEGVLGDLFWDTERIRIVTSETVIECDFDHERDEENENFPLDVPHPLVAEIKMSFDKGECTAFDILEVRLGLSDREGGMESSSDKINKGLYFLGAYGTPEVLEYIKTHPQCRKEDLNTLVRNITVTDLVKKLQKTGIITDRLELTEKGKSVLERLLELKGLLKNSN
ncbi:MAG: hypothetical protein AYK19_08275 [Theionarchaea archaeon DG-70-1]|nr:MAG: hypothetical protein AYK19_08275 [Theionarchaea archaeon DG-70-1]